MIGKIVQMERDMDEDLAKLGVVPMDHGITMGPVRGMIDLRQTLDAIAPAGANSIVMVNSHTQLFGVIGNPVRHSLSPVIHNGAFRRMGLNAAYLAMEVTNLRDAISGMRGLGVQGMSVTLPFKTEILPLLDGLTEAAATIGAVNTISNHKGRLIGHNTDWIGAVEALEEGTDLMGKKVLLLGAGGAGRAMAFGLKRQGCQVYVANRTPQKAADLARELGVHFLQRDLIGKVEVDVVMNATSVGMSPRSEESPIAKQYLKESMVVMDAVYNPLKTRLLRDAEEKGCRTIDGLDMLSRQGAAQLRIWTGRKPDIREIKADLSKALS